MRGDGELLLWGRNWDGQLGLGGRKDCQVPTALPHKPGTWTEVGCGADFTIAVDKSHNVYGWGHNDSAQVRGVKYPSNV